MNTQQSPLRLLTRSSYGISLGVLLTLCIYFRPDHRALSTLHHLSYQTAELDALESRSLSQSNATLLPRDTYQCSASKPCSNGACCGDSGYCGYGPTYCGPGCVSDCNAVAECGQYAKIANTQCPLNTCCSQFGFCGTTTDFCGKGCQSNCILNPTPSGSGSSSSILQNKVIGYYESWSARLDCHKVAPTDLPLDALTHINFAFAYIDTGSLQVVTMDGSTPSSLFSDITNVKSIKEDLSIFVSIGGWSFSDNGTATQPLYGEIAADAGKRQTFADNVVHFMKQYGFDGLDIDWEYPGAPDRGGQEEDTENYILLLQVLRQTFDRSGNKFGLSFTTPSSYWYLRWFDLPNMIKYADWINLMSYDLHGVWDATDPIGSIVQGHTNLTEIKLATELFWRVHIPPEKIVMGFGFYGRSFTLADPGCSKPGCPFSGASNPGPCSATGGILAYYEIMNILNGATTGKKRGTISPTHDSVDAVNYFTFDNDQWVSYDDATTFKQKVDWANGVGLGGALIWASDLDDGKYTAHAGLLGRSIQSTPSLQNIDKALSAPQAVIQDLAGSNGQNCFTYEGKCVNLNDNNAVSAACGAGNTSVGWDDAGCGKKNCHCGKPICCPTNTAPKNCMWRGDNNGKGTGSDCSAQCAPGEVNIQGIGSSWGGGFLNDGNTNKCGRGRKVFCCPSPDFQQVTQGCSYAGCRKSCPTGTTSIFEKAGECVIGHQQYCCPDPVELTACHWVGGTRGLDCVNAVCNSTELEIDRAQFGGSQIGGCSYGRTKAACCTVQKAPPKPASCSTNLCKALPGFCNDDDDDESANGYTKRDLALSRMTNSENLHVLEERGGSETYRVDLGNGIFMHVIAIAYPAIGALFGGRNAANILRQFFRLIPGYCTGPSIQTGNIGKGKKPSGLGNMQTEHPIDRQVMGRFVQSSASGSLPSGAGSALPPIRQDFYTHDWDMPNAQLHARPAVGGPNGIQPLTPNDRAMEAFGSNNYPNPFMAVDSQINGAKGRIMNLRDATGIPTITELANIAVQQDSQGAADELLQAIRVGIATFDYLRTPEAVSRWNEVRQQVRTQLAYIEADVNVPNLAAWWDAFTTDFFGLVEQRAQQWAHNAINAAAAPFTQAHTNGQTLQTYGQVLGALEEMLDEIDRMTLPPNNFGSIPNPQPPGGGGGGGGS